MNSSTVIELLSNRPFIPLVVSTNDGRQRKINHPELAIVGKDFLMIALKPENADLPEAGCFCSLANITSIEPAMQQSSEAN